MIKIAGVRFRNAGKVYYFDPKDFDIKNGSHVIVETTRGIEYGTVVGSVIEVEDDRISQSLRAVIRVATPEDEAHVADNQAKEKEAMMICREKIKKRNLEMKLIDAEYTFDNSKILFYFTADGRIDFRELVKDLAAVFRTRIELRQIGVRDETKLLGGLGICGRELCCSTYLKDFVPVSIRMAKEQNVSLNPSKISGVCGRLMCCLKYEEDTYEYLNSMLPSMNEEVTTKEGRVGRANELDVLGQKVKVLFEDGEDREIIEYPAQELTFVPRARRKGDRRNNQNKKDRSSRYSSDTDNEFADANESDANKENPQKNSGPVNRDSGNDSRKEPEVNSDENSDGNDVNALMTVNIVEAGDPSEDVSEEELIRDFAGEESPLEAAQEDREEEVLVRSLENEDALDKQETLDDDIGGVEIGQGALTTVCEAVEAAAGEEIKAEVEKETEAKEAEKETGVKEAEKTNDFEVRTAKDRLENHRPRHGSRIENHEGRLKRDDWGRRQEREKPLSRSQSTYPAQKDRPQRQRPGDSKDRSLYQKAADAKDQEQPGSRTRDRRDHFQGQRTCERRDRTPDLRGGDQKKRQMDVQPDGRQDTKNEGDGIRNDIRSDSRSNSRNDIHSDSRNGGRSDSRRPRTGRIRRDTGSRQANSSNDMLLKTDLASALRAKQLPASSGESSPNRHAPDGTNRYESHGNKPRHHHRPYTENGAVTHRRREEDGNADRNGNGGNNAE